MTAKERPILFSAPMVRAILEGRKTQTRRVIKPQPNDSELSDDVLPATTYGYAWRDDGDGVWHCPYGAPGDRLWVRETFIHEPADYCWEASVSIPCRPASTVYRADVEDPRGGRWTPSIHMPRALSRIDLEVTGVRVERLQDISEADAMAEGIDRVGERFKGYMPLHTGEQYDPALAKTSFSQLWESINGDRSWADNPFVWVIEFKRIKP